MSASRSASPVPRSATPVTAPPNISHQAVDVKPENTTGAGAIWRTTAHRKNSSVAVGSGSAPVAQQDTVETTSAPAQISAGGAPAAWPAIQTAAMLAAISSAARMESAGRPENCGAVGVGVGVGVAVGLAAGVESAGIAVSLRMPVARLLTSGAGSHLSWCRIVLHASGACRMRNWCPARGIVACVFRFSVSCGRSD
ncbi:hypothetical protein D3C81_1265700 [compost metagenome]